ncbi:MAG: ABC transporter ATP-binding protein [Spirochaetaceae bacterium]|jgi:teichoic acid transport system ATP-binding protein|nr:ABC transporter ATP-binding protein [Spirochaetaceae bacterium]
MSDIVLEVKDVHLSYRYYQAQALKQLILRKERKKINKFEALKGISFQVERGTNMGIIGSNGSGKSTLLRILANTLTPDSGTVINRAGSVTLLSLGVGFKPDLTGYENIYLNGLLLGLSRKEIDQRMQAIVDFAELGEFVHNPVRTYSSGMKSRLSFSVAINVDPELLLIDELFSVGDEHFKNKSSEKIISLIQDNRTVIMVSHSLGQIKSYCDKVLWIDNGEAKGFGEPEEVIAAYLESVK